MANCIPYLQGYSRFPAYQSLVNPHVPADQVIEMISRDIINSLYETERGTKASPPELGTAPFCVLLMAANKISLGKSGDLVQLI